MKKSKFLLIFSLVVLTVISLNQVAYAVSETVPLTPGPTIVRNVELEKGDRLEGSFFVKDLFSWKQGWTGDIISYSVSVKLTDPKGQTVLSYTDVDANGDSFDYTAFYSGVYTFKFGCMSEYLVPEGIENPEVVLNYDVISPSQPTSTTGQQSEKSELDTQFIMQMIPIFAGIAICTIIAITAVYLNKNRGT